MFADKPMFHASALDRAITEAIKQLDSVPAYSDEYNKIVNQIVTLNAQRSLSNSRRVSPDTMAIVIGNLVGIALIVGHERANVVTSKALNFVLKAVR